MKSNLASTIKDNLNFENKVTFAISIGSYKENTHYLSNRNRMYTQFGHGEDKGSADDKGYQLYKYNSKQRSVVLVRKRVSPDTKHILKSH